MDNPEPYPNEVAYAVRFLPYGAIDGYALEFFTDRWTAEKFAESCRHGVVIPLARCDGQRAW